MNYQKLFDVLASNAMPEWRDQLSVQLNTFFETLNHGDYPRWQSAIDNLPVIMPSVIQLDVDSITIGDKTDYSAGDEAIFKEQLRTLMPWRKGPFNLFGNYIDTEWRSDMKWSRLKTKIKPLDDRLVLDIGCGNGYYGWRMLGENARHVVGLDPTLLFYMQFSAIKKYMPDANIDLLPFGIQQLPDMELYFDTVLSMGVIYHRRDPAEHLQKLRNCLKPGGELILETLVLDSNINEVLVPEDRYAKMNNVWAIPSLPALVEWAEEAKFKNVRIIDVTKTTSHEQRRTEWMHFESLDDFLDKEDKTKTIEGYPAPIRAVLLADK